MAASALGGSAEVGTNSIALGETRHRQVPLHIGLVRQPRSHQIEAAVGRPLPGDLPPRCIRRLPAGDGATSISAAGAKASVLSNAEANSGALAHGAGTTALSAAGAESSLFGDAHATSATLV